MTAGARAWARAHSWISPTDPNHKPASPGPTPGPALTQRPAPQRQQQRAQCCPLHTPSWSDSSLWVFSALGHPILRLARPRHGPLFPVLSCPLQPQESRLCLRNPFLSWSPPRGERTLRGTHWIELRPSLGGMCLGRSKVACCSWEPTLPVTPRCCGDGKCSPILASCRREKPTGPFPQPFVPTGCVWVTVCSWSQVAALWRSCYRSWWGRGGASSPGPALHCSVPWAGGHRWAVPQHLAGLSHNLFTVTQAVPRSWKAVCFRERSSLSANLTQAGPRNRAKQGQGGDAPPAPTRGPWPSCVPS